jgi:hypothetical protein
MSKKRALDVSVIMPQLETITLVDRAKKKAGEPCEFDVELFVPARAGIVLIQEADTIRNLLNGQIDESVADLVYQIMSMVFRRQHEFMTPEWCEANVDLTQTVVIITQIAQPLYEYLEKSGLLGNTETPGKNP